MDEHLPTHLAIWQLPALAQQMYALIVEATLKDGFIASWKIAAALPEADDLDVCFGLPDKGNAAKEALMKAGLIEEMPGLGSRYRACLKATSKEAFYDQVGEEDERAFDAYLDELRYRFFQR